MMLWDILFPNRCIFCRKILPGKQMACPECEKGLPNLKRPLCRIDMGEVERLYSAVYYDGAVPEAIQSFKFRGKSQLAAYFAQRMMEQMGDELRREECSAVCCVPMHRTKQRVRGYNQAQLLAQELASRLELPYRSCLVKVSSSRDQHTLSGQERKTNLKNSYRAVGDCEGKLLLVDDVCTTGATLEECAAVLKGAGAEHIVAVTVALTLKESERLHLLSQGDDQVSSTVEEPLKKT